MKRQAALSRLDQWTGRGGGEQECVCLCVCVFVRPRLDGSISSSGTPQARIHLVKPSRRQHAKRRLQQQSSVGRVHPPSPTSTHSPPSLSLFLYVSSVFRLYFSFTHSRTDIREACFLQRIFSSHVPLLAQAETSQQRTGLKRPLTPTSPSVPDLTTSTLGIRAEVLL